MASFNKIIQVGNLTRDPEYKQFENSELCTFTIAVSHKFKDKNSRVVEEVCFTEVTVWGKQAESCSKYLKKGSSVLVDGRLKLSTWEQEGQKRSKHIIVAETVKFLDSKME